MIEAIVSKIHAVLVELKLDLSGKIVLTEAATGAYSVTPLIAACAGAKVYAYTKDTKYGSVEDVIKQTSILAEKLGVKDRIEIIRELTSDIIGSADIITNSGHLRPIKENVLKFTKSNVVIPYMYEDWEFREEDLDIFFCGKKGVKVIFTNERHPKIGVFDYLGELAIRQIQNAGKSLTNNKFIVIANNDFGPYIANTLSKVAENVGVFDELERKNEYNDKVVWLGEFSDVHIPDEYLDAEAVIFTAYPFVKKWFSGTDNLRIDELSRLKNPFVLRFAGDIDTEEFDHHKISYFPDFVSSGHMGILLSELGYDSIIRLQAGGLKVAELGLKDQFIFEGITIGKLA